MNNKIIMSEKTTTRFPLCMVIDIACYIDIHKYTKQITLNLNIPASLFIASKHEKAEKAH